jgi:hypothetical protein
MSLRLTSVMRKGTMTAFGTSRTPGDVRLESAKRAKADIEQVAVADARDGSVVASPPSHGIIAPLHE